jgi:hypothetical protein
MGVKKKEGKRKEEGCLYKRVSRRRECMWSQKTSGERHK